MGELRVIRAGVIGFGFMGQTHVRAYLGAARAGEPVVLTAVADLSGAPATGMAATKGNIHTGSPERLFDPAEVRPFGSARELLSSGLCDVVSVCTPTDTHLEVGLLALQQGHHVLMEKPVAVRPDEVRRLREAEQSAGRRVMPGMCIRFWPGWTWLAEAVRAGPYGVLKSLRLVRLGSRPDWSAFYADDDRCGGAIVDLHLHDVDYVLHLLGVPSRVFSVGTRGHLQTSFMFAGHGPEPRLVTAEGGWLDSPGRGFRMKFVAEFERATAEFDLGRAKPLTLTREDRTEDVEIPSGTGYEGEVREFVRWAAVGGRSEPPVTLMDAEVALAVIEAEKRSLATGEVCVVEA